jgi:hypothetical protein
MTHPFRRAACLVVLAAVPVIARPSACPARAGNLDRPSVAMSTTYPAADAAKLKAALDLPECKFLDGRYVNAATTLRYGGDAAALSKQLDALTRCHGLAVHLTFDRPSAARAGVATIDVDEPGCAWTISHIGPSGDITVRINLGSDKVKLEELNLPPLGNVAKP